MKKTILKTRMRLRHGFVSMLMLTFFSVQLPAQEMCRTPLMGPIIPPPVVPGCTADLNSFIPNSGSPIMTLNVAVYALNLADGSGALNNFPDSDFTDWIDNLNDAYSSLSPAVANVPGTPYIYDTRIQFNLVAIKRPNVFISAANGYTIPPADIVPNAIKLVLVPGPTGTGCTDGFAAANRPGKLVNFYLTNGDLYNTGYHISHRARWAGHEIGHLLGLMHPDGQGSYTHGCSCGDDGFSDTYYPDCSSTSGAPCGTNEPIYGYTGSAAVYCGMGVISNNMMGYNGCQDYFSPKQIATMRMSIYADYGPYLQSIEGSHPYCMEAAYTTTYITANTTYSSLHIAQGDIYVNAGKTLTITSCVYMPADARIIVMPTAQLIIDGGSITSSCYARMWKGIELRGASASPQYYGSVGYTTSDPAQGVCIIKNNSVIANAKTGVYVGGRSIPVNPFLDPQLSGGVLQVENSSFYNCYEGVHFTPYFSPYKGGNRSFIKGSNFTASRPLQDPNMIPTESGEGMQYGIYFDGSMKVLVKGNTFQSYFKNEIAGDDGSNETKETIRGTAIYANNSQLNVVHNRINDFRDGIKAYSNAATFPIATITGNKLKDNLFGISGNFGTCTIDSNTVVVPGSLNDTVNIPAGSSTYPWGIFLDNGGTFKIYADSILTEPDDEGGGPISGRSSNPLSSRGLIIKNSGSLGGEVKNNCYFGGLFVGTQTEQNNQNLQIRCNDYENNTLAWRINPQSTTSTFAAQGSSCSSSLPNYRSNNRFWGCGDGKDALASYLNTSFNYYYWNDASGVTAPCVAAVNNHVVLNGCGSIGSTDPNACPAHAPMMRLPEVTEKARALAQQNERAAELGQNIPNPSNTNALIKIYVPEKSGNAILRVLNGMGQQVMEKDLVKGEQEIALTTSELKAGVYTYTLYIDDKAVSSKRMVVMK